MSDVQINLSEKKFRAILDDYFAEPKKRQRMTQSEIEDVAKWLNEKINIPLINEKKEGRILLKIVLQVDSFIYDNLPNELYDLMRSLPDGISDEEAKTLIKRFAKLANDKIDIPYLPEAMEYIAIRFIIALVFNAMRKKLNVAIAGDKLKAVKIPDKKDISDNDLAGLLVA